MFLKKRSVSPLITTILLIVVSVILITVVLTWGKGFTESTIDNADLFTSFTEDVDLKNFIIVDSFIQTPTTNNLVLKNSSDKNINIVGYSLHSVDSNYVFLEKRFYLEETLNLTSGSFNSLPIVCAPSSRFSIQLITDQNTFVEIPIFTNNLDPNNYCLGKDLVGYWSFDEGQGTTAYDYSGNNYEGIINNGAFVDGISGSALYFNGESSNVNLGTAITRPKLQMGYGSITVEHWINPPEWASESSRQIFSGIAGGGSTGYGVLLSSNGSSYLSEVFGETGSRQRLIRDIGIIKNQWNHIVTVFGRTDIKFYNNGELKHTLSIIDPGNVYASFSSFRIGSYHHGAIWFFLGAIDEVRVYNRSLSDEEVKTLYGLR